MSCLQSAVNVCFEKMKIDNTIDIFVWGGSLHYISKGEKIYQNINVIYRNDTNEYLEKYFNVAVDCISLPSEEALKIASDSLNYGMMVIFGLDAMYCPWNKAYNAMHFPHYCIIEKIDFAKQEIIAYDEYMCSGAQHSLPLDLFHKGYSNLRIVKKCNRERKQAISLPESINELIYQYTNEDEINSIYNALISDIKNFAMDKLFETNNPENSFLLLKLNEYKNSRFGIATKLCTLNVSTDEKNTSEGLVENYYNLGKLFEKINSRLVRIILKNSISEKDIASIEDCLIKALAQEIKIKSLLVRR